MPTAVIQTHQIKSPGEQHRVARELGIDPEELDKFFKHGEYYQLELEVDEDLNIVGGQFKQLR